MATNINKGGNGGMGMGLIAGIVLVGLFVLGFFFFFGGFGGTNTTVKMDAPKVQVPSGGGGTGGGRTGG